MLFLAKIAITPLLVAAVSLAARWWGPTIGGMLMGLPWFTGPVLFVLVLDRGTGFGVAACVGIELGVVCVSAFMLVYGLLAAVARWPLTLAAAVAAFFASAAAVSDPGVQAVLTPHALPPLWSSAGVGAVSLLVVLAVLPRSRTAMRPQSPPWWDIPARMATAAAIVVAVVVSADALGPRLAGVLSTYPIIVTVVGVFTHQRSGHDAARRVLRGVATSLLGFVAFFLVAGLTLPGFGLFASYGLAALTAMTFTAGLLVMHRWRHARPARSAGALRPHS